MRIKKTFGLPIVAVVLALGSTAPDAQADSLAYPCVMNNPPQYSCQVGESPGWNAEYPWDDAYKIYSEVVSTNQQSTDCIDCDVDGVYHNITWWETVDTCITRYRIHTENNSSTLHHIRTSAIHWGGCCLNCEHDTPYHDHDGDGYPGGYGAYGGDSP